MNSKEIPGSSEFQAYPRYEDPSRAPKVVVEKTYDMLDLLRSGGVGTEPDSPANIYFRRYTVPYLASVIHGANSLFDPDGSLDQQAILEENEASGLAFVIFASMHEAVMSKYLPTGFSRRGMLKAPSTRKEFEERVKQIRRRLNLFLNGQRIPNLNETNNLGDFKTLGFFFTGKNLPPIFPKENRILTIEELLKDIEF